MSERFTHVDEQGAARMVDVSGKLATARRARAGDRSNRCEFYEA